MYSTHAQRVELGRTSTLPLRPERILVNFAVSDGIGSNGAPSEGVFRFATNGEILNDSGAIFESSRENRTSSSMSFIVSPGNPTIS